MTTISSLIKSWEGEYVVTQYDRPTGAWIFIAIHSGSLGTPTGGTRFTSYRQPQDALQDAMRLARGMTHKWAVVDFPKGGGKAVITAPPSLDPASRRDLLLRYGDLLEQLGGAFETGPDLGTTPEDMNLIGQRTKYVFGKTVAAGGAGEAGYFTAKGVFAGIVASSKHAWGSPDLKGKCVLVQGVGSVGGNLIQFLSEAGAEIKFSEVNPGRVEAFRDTMGLQYVAPDDTYKEPCDIFAPCAAGGILNHESISQLNCRIVAGAANNQLAEPETAKQLFDRNILYAPDFVINAGAAIALPALERMGWTPQMVERRVENIGTKLSEIFSQAKQAKAATDGIAREMARSRLAEVS